MRGIRCKALLCVLLACLIVGAGEMRGIVLCIGSAGHFAVEPAHGESSACECGACGRSGDSSCAADEAKSCGDCIDIPLSLCGVDRIAMPTRAAANGQDSAASCGARDVDVPQDEAVHAIADARRSVPFDPSLLRSVVLRL